MLVLAQKAGLQDDDLVLDAGCGVAGPAIIIASHYPGVVIEGVTNSERQAEMATNRDRGGRHRPPGAGPGRRLSAPPVPHEDLRPGPLPREHRVCHRSRCDVSGGISGVRGREAGSTSRMSSATRLPWTKRAEINWRRSTGCGGVHGPRRWRKSLVSMIGAGFEVTLAAPLRDIGTAALRRGRCFTSTPSRGSRRARWGRASLRLGLGPAHPVRRDPAVKPH